jgi:signal transduction histidine kinase
VRALSLQGRTAVALGVVAVLVLAGVALAAAAFAGTRAAQRDVVDLYYEAVTSSNEQFLRLVDADAAVRGYQVSGDPADLEPVLALGEGNGGVERLMHLLRDDPHALAALEEARQSAGRWYTDGAQPIIRQVQAHGPRSVPAEDVARNRQLFAEVRSDYSSYVETLGAQRHDAVDVLHGRTALLFASVVAVAVVAVLAVAMLGWFLRRWVTRPVEQLAAETRIVHGGALDHVVTVSGPPELERLARDVESMRQQLVAQIAAARHASAELAEAHAELAAQATDLQRSNRELEQFAYVASHDLQEPLRKVASFCELLQRRYSGQLDERADQYIAFAVDGAKRMQQLINDLLEFSRVGRVASPQTDVDLDACLRRALDDLSTAIEESGALVTHDPLPIVHGEQPLLTRMLLNLVGNAVKFRSEEPPKVHVGVRRDGDTWQMWCSDNGIGIDAQYAERVFVLFQRLHTKDAYSGTGIGLALCRKIAEHHGGRMWVDVDPGGAGTTVRWTLPVRQEPEETDDGVPDGHRDAVREDGRPALANPAGVPTGSGGPDVA